MLETELETSDFISDEEIQMLLQKAILELTEKQRLVFNMHYFDGMEYADIAEIVESTVGSVKVLYYNAKFLLSGVSINLSKPMTDPSEKNDL